MNPGSLSGQGTTSTQDLGYAPTAGAITNNQHIPHSLVTATARLASRQAMPVQSSQSISPPSRPSGMIRITLDGEDIYFDRADLPGPPAVHYSTNLPGLFRDWHDSSLLTVGNRGIPIKHWDKLYNKRKGVTRTNAWTAIKMEWMNWKVCCCHLIANGSTLD